MFAAQPLVLGAQTSPDPGGHKSALDALASEALRHRAAHHPYLISLAGGELPDTKWALADFARHYYFYSIRFPQYLTAVISRLDEPGHRKLLLENLSEESGQYAAEELVELAEFGVQASWIVGVPHPQLFQRFSIALGVEPGGAPEADVVRCWREMFTGVLLHGTPAEAVGAIGLGTEQIVRAVYDYFVKALVLIPELSPSDSVFFPLHTAVDDHHQASLQAIAADLASRPGGLGELRRGMLKALQLRTALWDWLHARALDPAKADEVV